MPLGRRDAAAADACEGLERDDQADGQGLCCDREEDRGRAFEIAHDIFLMEVMAARRARGAVRRIGQNAGVALTARRRFVAQPVPDDQAVRNRILAWLCFT